MSETMTKTLSLRAIGMYGAATLLTTLLPLAFFWAAPYFQNQANTFSEGISNAQLILLGTWAAMARVRTLWRIVGVIIGVSLVWSVTLLRVAEPYIALYQRDWMMLVEGYSSCTIPVWSVWLAMSIVVTSSARLRHQTETTLHSIDPFRFGSLQALLTTMLVAGLFMASGFRFGVSHYSYYYSERLGFCMIAAINSACIAIASTLTCLGNLKLRWRLALVVGTLVVVYVVPLVIVRSSQERLTHFFIANIVGMTIVLVVLCWMRHCGYGLQSFPFPRVITRLSMVVAILVLAGMMARWSVHAGYDHDWTMATRIIQHSIYFGIWAAMLALLGVWAGLSQLDLDQRVALVYSGALVLWLTLTSNEWNGIGLEEVALSCVILATATACIFLGAFWLRYSKVKLRCFAGQQLPEAADTLQFGIWQILLATTVTSVMMSIGMATRMLTEYPIQFYPGEFWRLSPQIAILVLFIVPAYCLTTFAALWATLGLNRPLPRLALVMTAALTAALAPLMFLPISSEVQIVYIASCLFQTCLVVAVLLVARSAGYRLVPLRVLRDELAAKN